MVPQGIIYQVSKVPGVTSQKLIRAHAEYGTS